MFAHAEVNDTAVVCTGFEAATFFDIRVVGDAEIGRATNQHRHVRRQRIDDFAAGNTSSDGFGIIESWQMLLPIIGQLAAHCAAPKLAQIGMFFTISFDQVIPFALILRAAIDRFTEMRQCFIGNVELLVFRPAEMTLRFAHGILARRVAVGFTRARRRHAVTNDRLDRNQRRLVANRLRVANRGFDRGRVVSIFDCRSMPTVRLEALRHIFGKREIGEAFNRYLVVVVEIDQLAEFEVTGERGSFRRDAFHQVSIGNDRVDIVID